MIRVAIVDDEASSVEQLKNFLIQYQKERNEVMNIVTFSDGDEIVENYKAEYDIILLDIEMKFMDGMTAAEHIRKVDPEVVIIFITNMAQYAIKGYTVNATDYVLKPVSYFAFSQRIDKVVNRMDKKEKKYLAIGVKGGTVKLYISDIYYIESQGHRLIFHTKEEEHVIFGTMKEIEEKLKDMDFYRCNKGSLLNLAHVDGVQDGIVSVNKEQIVISRGRKKEFMEALTNYLGGALQ
ncbi:LytR/AlgR family response regulator transcription factor [Anaeromicropila herbilytica]|uniref:Stage 0 sporulation protein A homolog n=1 Tax=Anaeromicropila herbilytica TaxID=2785025 RepID=A0A7R7EI85_9FIRM|nr:LytTR family DNA-binding domain-containing protein [Anaeromicropila herbilytica]BCN29195.1 DNA-binding response regulator [Anaeromicropila herbilytica]